MGVVFFFQAEDGIRDLYVTGVQTCALPISTGSDGGPPSTWPVSSEKTPSCHGQVTVQRAGSTVPSDRLARAWVQRFAIACTVPRTLKSATASPPTYTRRLAPAGRSASVATGVYPSARIGRRAVAWADPAPPNVSSMSHRDICTHVKVGVSRSV